MDLKSYIFLAVSFLVCYSAIMYVKYQYDKLNDFIENHIRNYVILENEVHDLKEKCKAFEEQAATNIKDNLLEIKVNKEDIDQLEKETAQIKDMQELIFTLNGKVDTIMNRYQKVGIV